MAGSLRIGLIGYRFMGRAHSNAWRQAPRFFPLKAGIEMHTICGRDAAATDWRQVVNSPEIDVVDISTPNDSHAEIAIAAAAAGKHILCEKPLALTVRQCEAMVAAVRKARVVNMVCHNYRRIPAIAQARRMIQSNAIGRVLHFRARYAQDWPMDPDFPLNWRFQKGISGSGANGDILSHIINLGRHLVGEYLEVSSLMHTFVRERPVPDPTGKGQGLGGKGGKRMAKVNADFVDACVAGKSVQPTFEDGLANQRVLEAVDQSARTRQWVRL